MKYTYTVLPDTNNQWYVTSTHQVEVSSKDSTQIPEYKAVVEVVFIGSKEECEEFKKVNETE